MSEPDFFPLSADLSSCGDCSISPVIFVVVVGLRELVCDVSGPDYPLSTDLSSSWRLLPRCLLLAWWLPRPLTLRRDVSERAVSAVDVPVERVASVAVLPVTCVVVLGKPACGRDVSEPYSSVVGDLSSSWRLFFLLLDTCLGVIGSSSLDLAVPEPCSSPFDARAKLEPASTVPSVSLC